MTLDTNVADGDALHTRAAAILTGQPYELQIIPQSRSFNVVPAAAVSKPAANVVDHSLEI